MAKAKKHTVKVVSNRASKSTKSTPVTTRAVMLKQQKAVAQQRVKDARKNLAAARSQVRIINAQLKETRKAIATTNIKQREIKKQLKAINKTLGKEYKTLTWATKGLERAPLKVINRELGKEYKTLRNALKAIAPKPRIKEPEPETTRATARKKPEPKLTKKQLDKVKVSPIKRDKMYSVRELSEREGRGFTEFIGDMRGAKKLDQYLGEGEYYAAMIPYRTLDVNGKVVIRYARTRELFSSASALFKRLTEYSQRNLTGKYSIAPSVNGKWVSAIQIVKVKKTLGEWKAEKAKEVLERQNIKAERMRRGN